jgi:hypothetical protein
MLAQSQGHAGSMVEQAIEFLGSEEMMTCPIDILEFDASGTRLNRGRCSSL